MAESQRITKFDIGDFNNELHESAATKIHVVKQSKMCSNLLSILRSFAILDDINARAMTMLQPSDIDTIIYAYENREDVDDDTKKAIDAYSSVMEILYPSAMLKRILDKINAERYDADDLNNVTPCILEDNEMRFVDALNINDRNHPLYAIYKPADRHELYTIVHHCPYRMNLNWLDVSEMTNFKFMFIHCGFDGDISLWDTSNGISFEGTFCNSRFNGDISQWQFPKATDMRCMFYRSSFNGEISAWKFPNVTTMREMFAMSDFNRDISGWVFPKVEDMSGMFARNPIEMKNIADWHMPEVTNMYKMFCGHTVIIKGDLNGWTFPKVTCTESMFEDAVIDGLEIGKWTFGKVVNAEHMFRNAKIRKTDLSGWKFPKLIAAAGMFYRSECTSDLSTWELPKCDTTNFAVGSNIGVCCLPPQIKDKGVEIPLF